MVIIFLVLIVFFIVLLIITIKQLIDSKRKYREYMDEDDETKEP